jgi:hypothetical protein
MITVNNSIKHISTNEFVIYQDKRKKTIFTITSKNNVNCIPLFRSISKTKILNSSTIVTNPDNIHDSSLIIKASTIKTFHEFKCEHKINTQSPISPINPISLRYSTALKIVFFLSKQISYLLNYESKCFYGLDPINILVIDDTKFIYLSHDYLKDVKHNNIHIYNPISKKNCYLSPELMQTTSLPILLHYKTIFYSLGLLILDNLEDKTPEEKSPTNTPIIPNTIKDTKLYFFLQRCLDLTPQKRYLLYV